jgi:hypothetical protein
MTEPKVFTEQEVARIAESAAERAIASLLAKLDVDSTKSKEIIRLRDDLNFLKDQREGSELLKQSAKKGALYLMGLALMGTMWLSWDAFKLGLLSMIREWLTR